ncbi:putative transporter [Suttonella ornithocola]|uniref:Putative transporter n=1 Tax=Suttonella ornithocola TaxID=279832 RepID=A0A380MZR1_9GAMM|nr:putative transporter [Suttonella ornithocola]SUO97758.1 putative transporter [Suttonella ornithocola]
MNALAMTIVLLAVVAMIGLWLGNFKIRKISLGIGGVLFGGIFVGHFLHLYGEKYGLVLDSTILTFCQEFGLILFVYTIGIQVGPGFFASLRQSGLRLNALAAGIVFLGSALTVLIYWLFKLPLPVILGVYSGAVTNTPSLGAGQQILNEIGFNGTTEAMGMGYAVAYPFGICGILLAMWLIRAIFKVNPDHEATRFSKESHRENTELDSMNLRVTNANLDGHSFQEIPIFDTHKVVCSRLRRGEEFLIPTEETALHVGDFLHIVGESSVLRQTALVVGEEVNISLSTRGTPYRSERVVVTNEQVLGKKIRDLNINQSYQVVISRLNRAGVELVPTGATTLQFGDILNLVGSQEGIEAVCSVIGNVQQKLQQVQMLPVFIGIALGVLLGSVPFSIPGLSVPLRLGLAGGPLVVALLLGRIGSIGGLYWFMPPSANLALRELGIVLFLSVIGIKSGGHFIDTLVHGDGLQWMALGAIITLIPLLVVGCFARYHFNLNYLSICGLLAGAATDPPALAFANDIREDSGAAALSYATVYPLVMFLRIMSPQLIALLLWSGVS